MASSSRGKQSYQVFLSFRGKDVRKNFVDHLYTALDDGGIRTFKDDEELEEGKNIESELETAIQESRIAIVVFSVNYASSRWCLDELVRILKWKKDILPVFYDVKPSYVRYQTGSFSAAFIKHEERWTNKVSEWKAALKEVADISGMELQDGYESKFIKRIVQIVDDKLKRRAFIVPDYLIGIGSRIRIINKWLRDGSSEVGILTIYGTGGIGKTTIAKLAFNFNYQIFESSSYLPNVRVTLEKSDGVLHLYQELLSDMLGRDKVKIRSADDGVNKIIDVISSRKVLLVIDDVDQKDKQKLKPLLGMLQFFCEGSKIILTTRDRQLLKGYKAYKEFEIQKLDDSESLELFSLHAFGQYPPPKEYLELTKKLVSYCEGLPLALRVLGSSLHGEALDFWRNTTEKLQEVQNPEVYEVLKVSYDSLPDDADQNLFLEVACFFIGEEKSHVVTILNACEYYATSGIKILIDRCLLTVDKDGKLRMHQLLQDMGREIVRKESPKHPGKRSRLWKDKDSFNVLKQNTGTETIEGLKLNMDVLMEDKHSLRSCNINSKTDTVLETSAFTGMHSLRVLQMSNVQLTGGYKQFPKNLRFLRWHGFLPTCFERDFPLENLVAVDISGSKFKQLLKGTKVLRHLKILSLSHCGGLIKTPHFSQFPNLERLILKECINLVEVHESIVELEGLVFLNISECGRLRKLPSKISMLKALETLIISGCSDLEELPTDLKEMERLQVFSADRINFNTSHSNNEEDVYLHEYIWSYISKPKQVPKLLWGSLPETLVSLSLANCNLSDDTFPRDFYNMPSLQIIDLRENPISFLPDCIKHYKSLKKLDLTLCSNLQTLIGLPRVDELSIIDCNSLEKVTFQSPWSHSALGYLWGCRKLVDLEGIFKVVPLSNINENLLNGFGLQANNLDSFKNMEMKMYNCYTFSESMGSIQGSYEYGGIFSIFFPGETNVLASLAHRRAAQSLSFTVPSLALNAKIRGLVLRVVYARNGDQLDPNVERYIVALLLNETKGVSLEFYPAFYALPDRGQDIIWLSHWSFESHQIEACDQMHVIVSAEDNFQTPVFEIKEVGINFVYDDQEKIDAQSNDQVTAIQYEPWTTV